MQPFYLVDGYNLLHAMGVLLGTVGPHGLERARLRLQGMLAGSFDQEAGRVTIVFDAAHAPRGVAAEQVYKGVHIQFAVGYDEADDLIEVLLSRHGRPKQLVVVSDDHRLQTAARRKQAQPMSCAEFLDELQSWRRRRTTAPAATPEKCEKVTQDEARRWLEEFAGIEQDPDLREVFDKFDSEED